MLARMSEAPGHRALVEGALRGDGRCFVALIERHAGAVRNLAWSYVRNTHDASDICQETFVRAHLALASLNDPERFRSWLLAIARHAAIDCLRSRSSVGEPIDPERAIDTRPAPEESAIASDLAARVRAALQQLSTRDAAVIAMVAELGFTPAEVAQALGTTTGAAKVAVHRARRRLATAAGVATS